MMNEGDLSGEVVPLNCEGWFDAPLGYKQAHHDIIVTLSLCRGVTGAHSPERSMSFV